MRNPKIVFINYCLPIIGVIFLAGMAYAGWTPPPTGSTPPVNNVEPPISSSSATAYKAGALGVGGLFEADVDAHFALLAGKVGIGTSNPTEKLQIAGKALADDFCLNGDPTKCLSNVSGSIIGDGGSTQLDYTDQNFCCLGGECKCKYASPCPLVMDNYQGCSSGYVATGFYASGCGRGNEAYYFVCTRLKSSAASAPSLSFPAQLFSSAGSFTVPTGVTAITVELWGGGGGGGGGGGAVGDLGQQWYFVGPNIGGGGGGGGAGGHKKSTVGVTPGASYAVMVGAGGGGGTGGNSINYLADNYLADGCGNNGSSGGNGGLSAVAGLISVSGGSGGQGGHPACWKEEDGKAIGGHAASGGNGGTAGEGGSNGAAGNRWAGGGRGGFSTFGQGGSGRSGGIGAYMNGGTTGAPGDGGSDGFVIITW